MNWKFSNLEAWELKFGQKLRLWRLKFQFFFYQKGACELTIAWNNPCELRAAQMGPLWTTGEVWKWGFQGRTSPCPICRSVPPPGGSQDKQNCVTSMCQIGACRLHAFSRRVNQRFSKIANIVVHIYLMPHLHNVYRANWKLRKNE